MKIIHKSILKELTFTFILTLAFLNLILMMEKVVKLTRFLSGVGASVTDIIELILYLQPRLFLLTIPMAFLLSVLLIFGRLNLDNEIVILKSSGMDFKSISRPVFILGTLCFFINISVSFYIGPKSGNWLREEITKVVTTRFPSAIEEGTFNTTFKDIVFFISEKPSENTLKGIFMYDSRNKKEIRVLSAKQGEILTSEGATTSFFLKDGYIHIARGNSTTELFFKRYNMILSFESELPSKKASELTPFELIGEIKTQPRRITSVLLELHRRLSLPLLCIIIIFLGPPLSLFAGKSGRLGGLALGLMVFTVYYVLLIYGENLVRADKIPHYIGAWASTILIGILSLYMFRKANHK
jgi:lipopolysaccharide export system permease protein